jgi:hypothetical protein
MSSVKSGAWAGVVMVVLGACAVVACSAGQDAVDGVTTEMAAAADAGACKHIPKLHPAGAGPYCPFLQPMGANCPVHEHCCYPAATASAPKPPTTCAAACAAGPSTQADFACDSATQCATGQVCCGLGSVEQDPNPMCGFFGSKFDGTYCAAAATGCKTTEVHLCANDADCAAGKKCVAFATRGKDLGFCH